MANAGRVAPTGRFVSRKLSPLTFSLYIIVLFGLSVFLFFFYSKDVLEDERTRFFFDDSTPKIQRSEPITKEKLWDWPPSHGLHACIKPTTKYKVYLFSFFYTRNSRAATVVMSSEKKPKRKEPSCQRGSGPLVSPPFSIFSSMVATTNDTTCAIAGEESKEKKRCVQ
ncbi:hypothetical protein V2J09_010983 [Rumex salicifolius]